MYRLKLGWISPVRSAHSCLINTSVWLQQDDETTTITRKREGVRQRAPPVDWRAQKVDAHVYRSLKIAAHRARKSVETSCKVPCVCARWGQGSTLLVYLDTNSAKAQNGSSYVTFLMFLIGVKELNGGLLSGVLPPRPE